jgi:hypothetical protein
VIAKTVARNNTELERWLSEHTWFEDAFAIKVEPDPAKRRLAVGYESMAGANARSRMPATLAVLLTPRAAIAHGGGFELVLPAWLLGGVFLLWAVAGWSARARLKWTTTLVVVLAAWVGAIVANKWSDRSAPMDVAETWVLATVVVPLLVFATIRAVASRTKPPPHN